MRLDDTDVVALIGLGEAGDGAHLLCRLTRRSWDELGLQAGAAVFAQVKAATLVSQA